VRRRSLAALLFFPLVGAAACGPSPEAVERDRTLRAIDVLRDAPTEAHGPRRRLLQDLEGLNVTLPAAARARDACASAYRLLLDGRELERRVAAALQREAPPGAAVVQDLLDAEAKISGSAALMPDCDRTVAELRRPGAR
jgi:hypothetical protein